MAEAVKSRICPDRRRKHAIIFFIFRKKMDNRGYQTVTEKMSEMYSLNAIDFMILATTLVPLLPFYHASIQLCR